MCHCPTVAGSPSLESYHVPFLPFLRDPRRGLAATLLPLVLAATAHSTDQYTGFGRQLSVPALQIGGATYSGVVLTVGTLVSGPTAPPASAGVDSYDPVSTHLFVPSVSAGGSIYTNVVATVDSLVSIGGVSGADLYDGTYLHAPYVQVASTVYTNVVIRAGTGSVVRVAGGMPLTARDQFNAATGQLLIPAVVTPGGTVYTNVTLAVTTASLVSTAGPAPAVTPILGADAQRLAEQASFGSTPSLISQIQALGSGWIDAQIAMPSTGYAPMTAIVDNSTSYCALSPDADCFRDYFSAFPVQLGFFRNAVNGPDQLRQRVALAWSQIFVVSQVQATARPAYAMRNYQQLLLDDAFVNFRQLLNDVTLSPAMGSYLNMANNSKANPAKGISPNENYAREVMQLFSVGPNLLNADGSTVLSAGLPVPTYSQDTIEGFAAIFTGWTYPPSSGSATTATSYNPPWYAGRMIPVESEHEQTQKLLLNGVVTPAGQTAEADLQLGLDNIFNHPNVGPFIGRQLIRFLVTSNPSAAYVSRITAVFNNDGAGVRGNMAAVIKAILMDPEARGATVSDPNFGKLREPVVDVTAMLRALNAVTDGEYPNSAASGLGEPLFNAETVFSFYPPNYPLNGSTTLVAPQFSLVTTSTAISRLNVVNALAFAANGVVARPDATVAGALGTTVSHAAYAPLAGNPSTLIAQLNADLLHTTLSGAETSAILAAVEAIPSTDATLAQDRTNAALYLLLASPRYQITR